MRPINSEQLMYFLNSVSPDFASGEGDFIINSICTDSRKCSPGCLFVPLVGVNFDGHDYIGKAMESGAVAALSARPLNGMKNIIRVPDTLLALQRLASAYKKTLNISTVAITGSVGKTTTKEMTAAALTAGFRTFKTSGNYNNGLGVPLSLLSIEPNHEAAVIEMGMSAKGEISMLTKMVSPDIGIITNIGTSHIEHLGSQENIALAKFEILEGMKKGSYILLNGDDPFLYNHPKTKDYKPVYFGINNPACTIRGYNLHDTSRGTSFTVIFPEGSVEVDCGMFGEHIVRDALAALTAAYVTHRDMELAAKNISEVEPEGMRQRLCTMGDVTLIMDCYNANPDSMRASLTVLGAKNGRRVALLGDMLELGDFSEKSHQDIGSFAKSNCDILIAVGKYASFVARGAKSSGMNPKMVFTPEKDTAADLMYGILQAGDTVLVKGSRGMKMEDIISDCKKKMQR